MDLQDQERCWWECAEEQGENGYKRVHTVAWHRFQWNIHTSCMYGYNKNNFGHWCTKQMACLLNGC